MSGSVSSATGRVPSGFFDAHCDTVMKVLDDDVDFVRGDGKAHVTFPAMKEAGIRAQIFACFVLSERHPGEEAERAEAMIRAIEAMAEGTQGEMRVARSRDELNAAFAGGPIAAILGLEGADPFEGRAERLGHFFDLGVRDLIFAWKDNPFSGTAFGENTPLTREGERLLGLAEELGVMIDVSHLSDRAFDDVCRMATRPFIASHSNCRALCPSPRNLTDPMIRRLAARGGVMGINLGPHFLDPEFHRRSMPLFAAAQRPDVSKEEREQLRGEATSIPRSSPEWVVRHVLHAMDVGGENCVGLGGDLDGVLMLPAGIESAADYPVLGALLREAGLDERQVDKVSSGNMRRVFAEVMS
jgi:membrane dipeptidase